MTAGGRTVRSRLGHNAVLSFVALALPLVLAVFLMPVIARYLGPARFGLLGLAWAITEYAAVLDFGLGRSAVKFVAQAVHTRSADLNATISLSVCIQFVAGVIGGALLVLVAPVISAKLLKGSPTIAAEAVGAFRVVGVSVPIVLLTSGLRAVLEGAQRFDLSATLRVLSGILSLSIAAGGAVLGFGLPAILITVFAARMVMASLYAVALRSAIPTFSWELPRNRNVSRRVVAFGGWVFVSNIVSPLLVYFDRFALGALAGVAAVGFYVGPYEGITRVLLIPSALSGSLLPALTAIEAARDRRRATELLAATERVLAPAMLLLVVTIAVFAPELLSVWLGPEFALRSATALRVLAFGVLFNALAYPQLVTLYAMDRPDIPAKFHVGELMIHVPLAIALIRVYGITGAAAAWTLRVVIDFALLAAASARVSKRGLHGWTGGHLGRFIVGSILLVTGLVACKYFLTVSIIGGTVLFTATLASFVLVAWRWILDAAERNALKATMRSYLP
ncbi:MAG TPA: flippase [Gemmatimonadaceae bacterium]|nr:flippase [Gemmatimonadaceae bacterium]